MIASLKTGDKAPSFTTTAVGGDYGEGSRIKLSDLKGKPVVLYFYPKDDTPGCTTQACGIRDSWKKLKATGAGIFGVSTDPASSHGKFIRKFDLPFPLLADPERTIVTAYGVWVEKSMYGRKFMGTERTTFVIAGDGKIATIFRKVKPAEHAALLLKTLEDLDQ